MYVKEFPDCCGGVILQDFGYTVDTLLDTDYHPRLGVIKSFLQRQQKDHRDSAILMAILNEEQNDIMSDIFMEVGFKLATYGFNRGEDHNCYLYVWSDDPVASRERALEERERIMEEIRGLECHSIQVSG